MKLITEEELIIISTAITIAFKDAERSGGFLACTDGKLRRFKQEQAVPLLAKMANLGGEDGAAIEETAREVAAEAMRGNKRR